MRKLLLLFLLMAAVFGSQAQKRALLIVDIQDFYFKGPNALVNPDSAAQKAAVLLDNFRSKGDLVVHVKHKSKADAGIYYRVAPLPGEKVIEKTHVNAFLETDLNDYLKANGITDLVVCGMMTNMCVQAAVRAASDLGYRCTLVGDACATRNFSYNGVTVSAPDVHYSALATLTYYGTVIDLKEFLAKQQQ